MHLTGNWYSSVSVLLVLKSITKLDPNHMDRESFYSDFVQI